VVLVVLEVARLAPDGLEVADRRLAAGLVAPRRVRDRGHHAGTEAPAQVAERLDRLGLDPDSDKVIVHGL
jgi:hypothetical protein